MPKTRRRFALIVGSALLVVLAVGAAAFGLATNPPPSDWRVTPATQRLDRSALPERARAALDAAGAGHDVAAVGNRAGIRFYVGGAPGAKRCYMSGRENGAEVELGLLACLDSSPGGFPSEAQPVLDFSAYRGEAAPSTRVFVQWLAGFAANEVASVGVVTSEGETLVARVHNNVYASRTVPAAPVVKLIAQDRNGRVLWSRPLGAGPAAPSAAT